MLSRFFKTQSRIKKLCDGSTGSVIESFARVLSEAAYANGTARRHLRAAEHFLYWIRWHGITVREANEQALMRFANHFSQCQCPHFSHADPVGVTGGARLFASHLRDIGIIAAPVRQEFKDPELWVAFGHWMRQQRGTCAVTLSIYSRPVCELLARMGEEPSRLQASMFPHSDLLHEADVSMYAAKKNGRNRVELFSATARQTGAGRS
jgi:GGDEF domain-containing protein